MPNTPTRQTYINKHYQENYTQDWGYGVKVKGSYVTLSGQPILVTESDQIHLVKSLAVYELNGHRLVLDKGNIKRLRIIKKK